MAVSMIEYLYNEIQLHANVNYEIELTTLEYNATEWMKHHPGGATFIRVFEGMDATEAFYTYHRKPFPHQKMKAFAVSNSATLQLQAQRSDKRYEDFFELAAIVENVLPNKGFAPRSYYMKIFGLMSLALATECWMLYFGKSYVLSVLLGLCFAWIGLQIQHDANHGAISANANVNHLLGLMQCYIGGDNLKWIEQHVVQHHIFCNHYDKDPDSQGAEILRLHDHDIRRMFHICQCIYVWIVLSFYGFFVCFIPSKITRDWKHIAMKVLFVVRMFVAPFV
eukprot:364131_1